VLWHLLQFGRLVLLRRIGNEVPRYLLSSSATLLNRSKALYVSIEFRPNELASGAKAALLTTFSKTRYPTGGALAPPLSYSRRKADNAHGHRNCEVV
jgi:hypothetical protein